MTHEHRGAQRYDGHGQIQIAVAIYVRVQDFFRATEDRSIMHRTRLALSKE